MIAPDEWGEVQRIFAETVEEPPAGRATALDRQCTGRPHIRAEVESLLGSHDQVSAFLEPASCAAIDQVRDLSTDRGGLKVGPFKLIRPVGHGGMSVVYLAERVDGEFSQRVAVKIIDMPLRSAEVLQRFRAERQILATFAHPNIVSLIDAGVTADGQAYLVMEFVEGQPITAHCRDRHLPLDARIALLRDVCDAVQYAHQHGVVHRDLKPANILVTADGVAKVLDFGVAKLLNDSILASADTTTAGVRPLTPNYASPEQWRGQPTTTAADIYALGVLLYEILSGARPYDTSDKTLDEVLRTVVELDPPHPSAATEGRTSLPYSVRSLEGDLDAIVLKAMSKEPDARYSSARQLSDDLGRHLTGEPVTARSPSTRDVLTRLARRHRAAFVAAAVSLVALVGALGISVWQTRAARAERDRANARFNDTRQLANALIFKIHDGVAPLPGATPVRQMIVSEALVYLERLSRDPAGDDVLRLELARGYNRVADVLGKPGTPNLGDRSGAQASYRKGLALLRAIRSAPLAREAALELGRINVSLALTLGAKGEEAAAAVREATAAADRLVRLDPGDADALRLLGSAHFQNALMLDRSAALPEWNATAAIFEKLLAARPTDPDRRRNVALVQKYIGQHYENDQAFAQALPYYQRALALDEQRLDAQPSDRGVRFDVAVDLSSVALAEGKTGRSADAARDFERCLRIREQLAASDPKDVQARNRLQMVHSRLGSVYVDLGRLEEGLDHFRQALAIAEALAAIDAESRSELVNVLNLLGDAEIRAGRRAPGCEHVQRGLREIAALQAGRSVTPQGDAALVIQRSELERSLQRCGADAAVTGRR